MRKNLPANKAERSVRSIQVARPLRGRAARAAERAGHPQKRSRVHTIGTKKGATCDELLSLLNQYIDGGVNPKICKALEGHLAGCNPCRVVVDNVRGTIRLYREDQPCDLPSGFRTKLHAAIRDCQQAKKTMRTARKHGAPSHASGPRGRPGKDVGRGI